MGFARTVARSMYSRALPIGLTESDVESVAMFALFEAAVAYSETGGAPFRSYAQLRIQWKILDEIRSVDVVGRHAREQIRHGMPTLGDGRRLVRGKEADEALRTLVDRGADPEHDAWRAELRTRLARAIACLPGRHALLVDLVWARGLQQREAAEVLGVTASRVCQMVRESLEILARELSVA